MLIVLGIMIIGIIVGYLLRAYRINWLPQAINTLIWLLLFLLGIEVGCDQRIMHGLLSLGMRAIVISFLCILGSCIAALGLWRYIHQRQ